MLYRIINNELQMASEDYNYPKLKNEECLYWIDKVMPLQKIVEQEDESAQIITTPNTYTLTYAEKVDSLRFKRDWLLNQTDKGVVQDSPLMEERLVELKEYRQTLRDFTDDVNEENIDTYTLPQPAEWMQDWFKI